ncbi:MAG TPA: ABC transporter permease [Terriglobia bacterium]|nr:ABC transporter permease [Terriglobia bacterium]
MRLFYKLPLRFRSLFRRTGVEQELRDEVRFHLEKQIEENITQGMTPEEARYAALRELGGVEQIKEECRDMRKVSYVENFLQDVQYGVRQLRRSPGFTAVAILTLALGIGANTAIFSVVYAVLLKPLPFRNPGQLVRVFEGNDRAGIPAEGCSYQEFQEWQRQNHVFSGMAAVTAHQLNLTGRGEPMVVQVGDVTADFFSVLGVRPMMGRAFLPEDDVQGAAPVVVISNDLWRGRFGADPGLIGSTIELDKRPFTVVGVMPASFRFSFFNEGQSRQLWVPILQDPYFGSMAKLPTAHLFTALARLKPGISREQGETQMQAIGNRLWPQYRPGDKGWTIRTASLRAAVTGNGVSAPLLVLLAAVGLVLLIACANVANLLLARATSRAREFAVRAALGAGRARILRQLLTESAVLGLVGSALGIGLAYWGVRGLSGLLPPSLPRADSIRVDGSVLAFALVLALGASLLFGVAPALFAADPTLQRTLQESAGRPGEGAGRRRARNLLVMGEVALAMVLLVGAGLLIRSFAALLSVNPGFETRRILRAEVQLPRFQYSTPRQWVAFSNEVLPRIQADRDLEDTAIALPMPLDAQGPANVPFSIANGPPLPPGRSTTADYVTVSPNYFHVIGIPLVRGRYFSRQDVMSAPPVAIISKELARIYFPHRDPVGQQLIFGFPPDTNVKREIVGVVGDIRDAALSQAPGPMLYVPFAQAPLWGVGLVTNTSLDASAAAHAIEAKVHEVDRDVPVTDVGWMWEAVDASLGEVRLRTWLLGLFGAIALALAAAGVFGVIAYSVSCRTHEFGIRIALGGSRREILGLVLGEALRLALVGVGAGVVAALGLTRLISSLLFGVRATDPPTLIVLPLLLTGVALLAAYLPARRATRVDPMVALRHE